MRHIGIILAAGKGTRMKSKHAKVSHKVCDRPMIRWVTHALAEAGVDECYVVVGHRADEVRAVLTEGVRTVEQTEQLGTGHAVQTALKAIDMTDVGSVVVTCGDTPLLTAESYEALLQAHVKGCHAIDVMTTQLAEPFGYGRILRDGEGPTSIVEEKDASDEERLIKEVNVGTYAIRGDFLLASIGELDTSNAQGEFYLTDLVAIARAEGQKTGAYCLSDASESLGVNNRKQLAEAEAIMRARINHGHLLHGVTLIDPATTYIGAEVEIASDVVIEGGVVLEGESAVGEDSFIGFGSRLTDSTIGRACKLRQATLLEAKVGDGVKIGPYAYLRPGTVLGNEVKVGDFVEVKNSNVGDGSKIPHLTYVGDADVGRKVNIGCGTITCNYDGMKKWRTVIGDGSFIGSNTNLVAPVEVGKGSFIGAGTTIRKDLPDDSFAVTKAPLISRERKK